ncbi:MAG: hypothetical protein ABJA11_01545 [Pseudolysinimonas sp.]
MKLYSDFAGRRTAQIFADLIGISLIALAVWGAVLIHAAIVVLDEVGKSMKGAGDGFQKTMTDAGNTLGGVPLIGGSIRAPFDSASGAGGLLAQAGQAQQNLVDTAALVIAIASAVLPILVILFFWLRPRLRFARRATRAHRVSQLADGVQLLALRALVDGNAQELHAVAEHPVEAWRHGEVTVVRALAALELREAGVKLA